MRRLMFKIGAAVVEIQALLNIAVIVKHRESALNVEIWMKNVRNIETD